MMYGAAIQTWCMFGSHQSFIDEECVMVTSRRFFKEIRLQQFRSLVAVSRWQTYSAAAGALKLTRASVWQQVRGLEQQFSTTLVRTRGKRVELTPAGSK